MFLIEARRRDGLSDDPASSAPAAPPSPAAGVGQAVSSIAPAVSSGFDLTSLFSSIPAAISSGMTLFGTIKNDKATQKDLGNQLQMLSSGIHEQELKNIQAAIEAQKQQNVIASNTYSSLLSAGVLVFSLSIVGVAAYDFLKGGSRAN